MAPPDLVARQAAPSLTGQLFSYARGRVAFESPHRSPNKCILLGGLSDGLLPVPYTHPLESVLADNDWSLVQPVLSSSYTGFGHGSLDRDVQELDELLEYLLSQGDGQQIAMVGHSTGTQDIVHYMKHGSKDLVEKVTCIALQAPVSDREASTVCHDDTSSPDQHLKTLQMNMEIAFDMRSAGKGNEMMPRSAFWAPITANRFLDLNERGGSDDYFSSDFSDAELSERLRHIGSSTSLQSCLVAVSGSDEYVPSNVDSQGLLGRLCAAMNDGSEKRKAIPLYIPTGNHNLSSRDGKDSLEFLQELQRCLPSRRS